jgi:putative salt-induced outer membrane protein YdiY
MLFPVKIPPTRRHWGPMLALAVCGLLSARASASILVLSNGDRLTGKVLKHEHGKITFHSDVLGDVIVADTAATVVEPPASPTPVESMTGLPPQSAKPAPTPAVVQAKLANPGSKAHPAAVASPVTPWTGKVELGYDNQLTNERVINGTGAVELDRTVYSNEYLLKARYLYGKSDGLDTTDQQDAEGRLRHNLSDRLFVQSDSTESSDKIRQINFEGSENVGIGLKVYKNLRETVDVGVGATGQYLNAAGIQPGVDYLGNLFQDFTYKINGTYTFIEDASVKASPEQRASYGYLSNQVLVSGNERDYAYQIHTTLQGKISQHLSINLHWEYGFDNLVLDPTARGEERITTTLGYGF